MRHRTLAELVPAMKKGDLLLNCGHVEVEQAHIAFIPDGRVPLPPDGVVYSGAIVVLLCDRCQVATRDGDAASYMSRIRRHGFVTEEMLGIGIEEPS